MFIVSHFISYLSGPLYWKQIYITAYSNFSPMVKSRDKFMAVSDKWATIWENGNGIR